MSTDLDQLLPALRDSARGEPRAPLEVYQRLKFLARVLQAAHERLPQGADSAGGPLLLWWDERSELRAMPVSATGVVIGRDPGCDVVLAGPRVSRRHCVVRRTGEPGEDTLGVAVEDSGSSNGTFLNGMRLLPGGRELHDGDVIEVGGVGLAVIGQR